MIKLNNLTRTNDKSIANLSIRINKCFYLIFSILCFALLNVNQLYAEADIAASKVSINANNLSDGYINLSIPIYGSDGLDEGITPTSDRAGKIVINGNTVLRFWSFHAAGDPQSDADWYWVRSQRTRDDVKVWINDTRGVDGWDGIGTVQSSFTSGFYDQTDCDEDDDTGISWAHVRVCVPDSWLDDNLAVYVKYYIEVNNGIDFETSTSSTENISGLSFPVPNLSYTFSSTPGKFDVGVSVSPTGIYDEYEYKIDGGSYEDLVGSSATIAVNTTDVQQDRTVTMKYTTGHCNTYIEKTNDITLPAYPQATNFSVTQLGNGDAKITWEVNRATGLTYVDGDKFEIQRADNSGFSDPVAVAQVDYVQNSALYSFTEETAKENLNGTYYYRIRRTKTVNEWGWNISSETSITFSMAHKYIEDAEVTLSDDNITTTTWNYDTGSVWISGSQVIIERANLTTGAAKELITVPDDSLTNRSYSEELYQMCNRYQYRVYVKPGSANYTTQDPVIATGSIVPIETGNILSINASKGYFSDRTEMFWETDDKPIDYFSIRSRIYESGLEFKQIDQVSGAIGSTYYQYNDEQCNPGKIYEYQIIGITQCADVSKTTDTLYTYGFRTPTGDIYGRVTFENGQAVKDVELRLECDDGIPGKSIELSSAQYASVNNDSLLKTNTDSLTIQVWVSPDATDGNRIILSKPNMYELGINDNKFYFKVGTQTLNSNATVSSFLGGSDFVHLTGLSTADKLFIYINGELNGSMNKTGSLTGNNNQITVGEGFVGIIDEIRLWSRPLGSTEILRDYNRYLTGGEEGLIAYWSFNFATNTEFYDRSYDGSNYNGNHGLLNGATLNELNIPTNEQLGYKGVTDEDGSYEIRAIPYVGNGTVYTVIPRLGIHTFESREEVRFIGEGSQSHTVNFTDKSSFKVTGTITYDGGTIPVEGVSFTIDGVVAVDGGGNILMTDSKGEFEIQVPVGSHEVIAKKAHHTFKNDGKITDSSGNDLNYQDEVLGLQLKDETTVKYIGRVGGGALQDSYPVGYSLSKNNLADAISITLTTKNPAYKISSTDRSESFSHLIPSNKEGAAWPKTNDVVYSSATITIFPNEETGEFVAEVIPESYTIGINVPGHDDMPGSGEDLNLTQRLVLNQNVYEYEDSIQEGGTWTKKYYSDTVFYHAQQKFIKRYAPTVRISQMDNSGNVLPYFGDTVYTVKKLGFPDEEINLYPNGDYLLGKPVFIQNSEYHFKSEVFEKYLYYASDGTRKEEVPADEVPTQDATVQYTNNLSVEGITEVESDELGVSSYSFRVTEPELSSGIRAVSAKIYYGSGNNRTSINWNDSFKAIILGAIQTGRNFITGGPDKVLMVLRDPPGTNSYSYLEKGISVKESSKYTGNVKNTGSELFTQKLGSEIVTWTGVGGGTIQTVETNSGWTLGVLHEESIGGSDSKESVTTTTTRFQTSSSLFYVGASADVFIGYSTNIAYGSTENVSIISREQYFANVSKYQVYSDITPTYNSWLLVRQTGLGLSQNFSTMFAYTQSHIEGILLPEMEALRNNFLMQEGEVGISTLQSLADQNDTVFYVSHLGLNDPNYGKSNSDKAFDNVPDPDPDNDLIGASYTVVYPSNDDFTKTDTILFLNQSIDNWYDRLKANEKAKVKAIHMQNYSFQGGSSINYSESYSTTEASSVKFDIMIGGNFKNETGATIMGSGFKLSIDEKLTTTHGGEFSDSETESHSKGFVLSEDFKDYISVDVLREDADEIIGESYTTEFNPETGLFDTTFVTREDNFYPTFVFKTQAGATKCPYEGEYLSKYYEPGQHTLNYATKQIEVPEIAVENDFIENVPSGGVAHFTLYLRNNSEIEQDNWLTLKIVEDSNPNGAKLSIDGAAIGNGKDFRIPEEGTLTKTLEVAKGSVLNYDNLKLVLQSRCQRFVNDTVTFSVHFTPSCSEVDIDKPSDKWTYNTKLPVVTIDGVDKHYMDLRISGFDVNYESFNRIKLQYKSASESDDGWKTLMNYYADSITYQKALDDGWNAEFINPSDAGKIKYKLKMDDLPDQRYDLRAVSVCVINNEEIENVSEIISGIKDMLCPRLFGSAQPANGILTIEDEIRLNFNEVIAEGLLTKNNFQVTGIRNGAKTDHSVSISLDGVNDFMETEFEKNMADKDITVEMWINSDEPQNATLFGHGNINQSLEIALTSDNYLQLKLGSEITMSQDPIPFEAGTWAHLALVYTKDGYISAYYNFTEVISHVNIGPYNGIGNFVLGKGFQQDNFFRGFMHNVKVWNKELTSGELQYNSLSQLSGNELGLLAYYPMSEGRGVLAADKARSAHMIMNGCEWSLPPGRAIGLNGIDSYVKINTGSSAVIKESMDYTIEFWFKGEESQTNATLLSNGRGDGLDLDGSNDLFSIEFNSEGKLQFYNNAFVSTLERNYLDNNWHHFAVNVNRTIGRGQIYVDGNLINYFDANNIGGIASAYMYVGARAWYAEGQANTLNIDNFFKGEIDELRIWNLYKNEKLIKDNNNIKLDGEEMGLMAYYPFEYYKEFQGRPELDFTLADMKVQRDIANAVDDAENSNAVETSDIAPVKDKGPVSNLEFDFVVNNDALIIFLEESWEKIEKTIVTFTVDEIQDANGNENISPITWSAYIDRNQLKWSETELNLSKLVNEPLEFSVKAVNNGGSIQHFVIENAPPWMEITPMSGSINPSSSIDVSFVIDEGLNIGLYNEVIYMRNDNNVAEALGINLTVRGEKPDWDVNPADFEKSMAIFGKMRFNHIFSSDKEDILAAFNEGKCIGITKSTYIRDMDMWYALLTVYGNDEQSDQIEFRMWDASTGLTYLANPEVPISFISDGVVGTPANLIIFDAKDVIYQDIALVPGWNWISFNVKTNTLNDLNAVLADMNWSSTNYFKSEFESKSANYSVSEGRWIVDEPPFVLNNLLMYKVSSSINQTLSLSGEVIQPSLLPISVRGNLWSYISYLPNFRLTIEEALAGYDAKSEDVIKSQNGFAMYSPNIGWLGSLTYLEPSMGYMLFRNDASNVSFVYPNNSGTIGPESLKFNPLDFEYTNNNYSGNMNMVAISDIEPELNDRILAYVGNELSSETSVKNVNGELMYFITVLGENDMPVHYALERDGNIIGTTTEIVRFSNNSLSGTISNPVLLKFDFKLASISIYPNPTQNYVKVTLSAESANRIDISIVDILGREMVYKRGSLLFNGSSETEIDCSRLKSGIYFVNVTIDGARYVKKINKQ